MSRKRNDCDMKKNFDFNTKVMSFTPSKQYNDKLLTPELENMQCEINASVSEDLFTWN